MLWIICNHFKILPTDPTLRGLTWVQKNWLLANIECDLRQEAEILGHKKNKSSSEYGLDDEEFKELSKRMKIEAEQQREQRMRDKANAS